jgi:NADH:ubiquinone oxidoreductase subunit 4 (subunit M)
MPDLNAREWVAIMPLLVLMVWMGVAAQTFLPSISASNANTLSMTNGAMEQQVQAQPDPKVVADGR